MFPSMTCPFINLNFSTLPALFHLYLPPNAFSCVWSSPQDLCPDSSWPPERGSTISWFLSLRYRRTPECAWRWPGLCWGTFANCSPASSPPATPSLPIRAPHFWLIFGWRAAFPPGWSCAWPRSGSSRWNTCIFGLTCSPASPQQSESAVPYHVKLQQPWDGIDIALLLCACLDLYLEGHHLVGVALLRAL